jgi:hypothetical protein
MVGGDLTIDHRGSKVTVEVFQLKRFEQRKRVRKRELWLSVTAKSQLRSSEGRLATEAVRLSTINYFMPCRISEAAPWRPAIPSSFHLDNLHVYHRRQTRS